MSKFTPGPWSATPTHAKGLFLVSVPSGHLTGDCLGELMSKANAHLVAAAPEMLELLKDAHDVLLSRALSGGITDQTIMRIRAAIAKVEAEDWE